MSDSDKAMTLFIGGPLDGTHRLLTGDALRTRRYTIFAHVAPGPLLAVELEMPARTVDYALCHNSRGEWFGLLVPEGGPQHAGRLACETQVSLEAWDTVHEHLEEKAKREVLAAGGSPETLRVSHHMKPPWDIRTIRVEAVGFAAKGGLSMTTPPAKPAEALQPTSKRAQPTTGQIRAWLREPRKGQR